MNVFFRLFLRVFFRHRFLIDSIELPQGGPPPPPHLCARILGDCHAFKACMCRTAVLKAHGEMKAHILVTICPDLALMAGNLRNKSFSGECWLGGSKIEAWRLQNHPRQIEAQTLQNRARSLPRIISHRSKSSPRASKIEAPRLPKSSPGSSKTLFLRTSNLRGQKRSTTVKFWGQNEPTWLQFHVLRTYRRAAGWL